MKALHSLVAATCGALALAATGQAAVQNSSTSWVFAKAMQAQKSAAVARHAAQLRNETLLRRFWHAHGPGGVAPGDQVYPGNVSDYWQSHAPADRMG
jgi:hypothetical protein